MEEKTYKDAVETEGAQLTREPRTAPDETASAPLGLPGGGRGGSTKIWLMSPREAEPTVTLHVILGEDSADWSWGHNFC